MIIDHIVGVDDMAATAMTPAMESAATHIVTVTGYGAGGEGVARLDDGRVVFIRGAARSDVLEIALTKQQHKLVRADIVRILTPSPHRAPPDCPFYPECGGCDFRHITYKEELWAKLRRVNDAMSRIGGISANATEILHTGQIQGYRNKATFHSDGHSRFLPVPKPRCDTDRLLSPAAGRPERRHRITGSLRRDNTSLRPERAR